MKTKHLDRFSNSYSHCSLCIDNKHNVPDKQDGERK